MLSIERKKRIYGLLTITLYLIFKLWACPTDSIYHRLLVIFYYWMQNIVYLNMPENYICSIKDCQLILMVIRTPTFFFLLIWVDIIQRFLTQNYAVSLLYGKEIYRTCKQIYWSLVITMHDVRGIACYIQRSIYNPLPLVNIPLRSGHC